MDFLTVKIFLKKYYYFDAKMSAIVSGQCGRVLVVMQSKWC